MVTRGERVFAVVAAVAYAPKPVAQREILKGEAIISVLLFKRIFSA